METEIIPINGIEYGVTSEKGGYLLLVNPNDATDICVRKVVMKDGEEYLETLDSKEELEKALALFAEDEA